MEEYLNFIKNFRDSRILVVGDLMLDEYIWGDVDRISPEAPIPVLDVEKISFVPGGAANTAHNIKSLGNTVFLAGVIGSDEKGKLLKQALEEKGIDVAGLAIDLQRKTTLKTRVVAKNQQIVRIDIEDREPISSETEEKILNFVQNQIKDLNAVIIADYAKGVVTPNLSQKIIALARENNVLSFVDPKGADLSKYRGCSVITPNKKELALALNIPFEQLSSESKFLQAGKMLLAHVMAEGVLVKCGAEGMVFFEKDGNIFRYPAVNKKVIDVSGSGDIAVGVLALSLAAGADFKQAVVLASHACGVGIGKMGTAIVLPEELEEFLKDNLNNGTKQD